jgi:hypothetical protein
LEQRVGVQQADITPAHIGNLLAKVPNLALLAAGFFASIPLLPPHIIDAMGGKGH